MSIPDASRPAPYGGDTLSPKDFQHVSSLDPQIFATLDETAESLLTGKPLGKISPLAVAAQLETWASEADTALANAVNATKAAHADDRQFRRMAVDTAIAINLGRFFASKFRAAVFFAIFDQTGCRRSGPHRRQHGHTARGSRFSWARLHPEKRGSLCERHFLR